jgi:hypothetical protein
MKLSDANADAFISIMVEGAELLLDAGQVRTLMQELQQMLESKDSPREMETTAQQIAREMRDGTARFVPPWHTPQIERVAQALFDHHCERCARRGSEPHHQPGTLVRDMPPSYRDDYWLDARAAIEAASAE